MSNDLKADFGQAYVRAIAHAAGYFVQEANRAVDNDGVDLTLLLRDPTGSVRSPRLDVQLKTTACAGTADPIPVDLPNKNYEELIDTRLQVPRILVVVAVPTDSATWVDATDDRLLVRHCGYWHSLRGQPQTTNATTTRVSIARSNRFDVAAVKAIMDQVKQGGTP
jgi:hypothetical protein